MSQELRLTLLGGLEIVEGERSLHGVLSGKGQALLCYLAITGRPHTRAALAGLLWGEFAEARARTNLRVELLKLRRLVPAHLHITRQTVAFNRESPYWLDVEVFREEVSKYASEHVGKYAGEQVGKLREAMALYRGDFLEGFFVRGAPAFEEWVTGKREQFRELALHALHTLTSIHIERLDYAAAIRYATRLLALDPWREEAHRQLMLLYSGTGQRSTALAQYETCRRILAEELGVEPALETTALYERIRGARVPLHSLPTPVSPLVGRQGELRQIAGCLEDPTCRLLTLTGPGGIGKTRLALEAAAARRDRFHHGVYFVPLASVRAPDLLVPAIANALGFVFHSPKTPKRQLLNYLWEKETLLVLDNFEQLLAGADLLVEILEHAPAAKLLVTSRERLNLQEEWLLEVQGLPVPPQTDVATAAHYDAVNLFLQSARKANLGFTLAEAEKPHLARICQLVGGLPLGLELAAAWVRTRSCQEIAAELEQAPILLTSPLRNVPERHRSLQAVFDHSWKLLWEAEQRACRQLSVFQGNFTPEAAKAVAGAARVILIALVDKSLIQRLPSGRYGLHPLIKQYTTGKLHELPAEAGLARDRHCDYYLSFLQKWEADLGGERQPQALAAVSEEIEDVHLAWEWAIAHRKIELLGNSLECLHLFYDMRSRFLEGRDAFARAVADLEATNEHSKDDLKTQQTLVRLLARLGKFCLRLTLVEEAREILQRSIALGRGLNLQNEAAFAFNYLGDLAKISEEFTEAEVYFRQSLTIYEATGNARGRIAPIANMGEMSVWLHAYDEARQRFEEILAISRSNGNLWVIGLMLNNLGFIALQKGDCSQAEQLLYESLAIRKTLGDRKGMAYTLCNLGNVARLSERHTEAKQFYSESITTFKEIGLLYDAAGVLKEFGQVNARLGAHSEAKVNYRQALALCSRVDSKRLASLILIDLSELLIAQHESEQALLLLTLLRDHPESEKDVQERAGHLADELAANLPLTAITTAREQARKGDLEAVVVNVLVG